MIETAGYAAIVAELDDAERRAAFARAVVDSVQLREMSLRHQTVIIRQREDGVCVKSAHRPNLTSSLNRERYLYELLHDQHARVAGLVPELADKPDDRKAVTTRLLLLALSLREHLSGSQPLASDLCQRLGAGIAQLHTTDVEATLLDPGLVGPGWIAALCLPDRTMLAEMSAASQSLVQVLQATAGLIPALNGLAERQSTGTLIHNDLKWDNILVHPAEGETAPTQVKLIDWELAGPGDPCWDVGTVLSEFLAFWALSIPIVADEPPDTYMHLARYPLENMQPAISAFWQAYVATMEFDQTTAHERLIRSTRYAGARLIQTAYERTQTMNRLTPQIYLLLQLSLNVLEQPEDAAAHLLGITSSFGGA